VFFLALVMAIAACADVRLPAIIGDNMVLQQDRKATIWGWAEPNEQIIVRVSWHNMRWGITAGGDGKWVFKMHPPTAGGPYEMTITGNNAVTIKNILVGEVWVCSGQSNMQMAVTQSANGQQEIAAANYPNIRLFSVQRKVADQPQSDCTGNWVACSPQSVADFSAVAYYFGRQLHQELKVPVGLIHTSWGGTPAEAWTSSRVLKMLTDYKAVMEEIEQVRANPEPFQNKYEQQLSEWRKKIEFWGPEGKSATDAAFDDSGWLQMELPKPWEQGGLADFDGMVWFRKDVNVPESWVGKEAIIELGPIDDMDATFINGIRVGGIEAPGRWQTPRKYKVGKDVLKPGRNIIAVRIVDTGGAGGICGNPEQMKLGPAGETEQAITLAGQWRYKKGFDLKSMPAQPRPPLLVNNANAPTALYNAMIAPLIPYGIQGAIWYQGESNAGRAYQYRQLFPAMIKNWREDWGQGNFSFLFAQLANFLPVKPDPCESEWAELREAQTMTLSLPNTGMAVIVDIGDANDIHPKNKQDVGKRLALWALAKTYGKNLVYCGPLYKSMRVDGSRIILSFDQIGGGLAAKDGGQLKGFVIAGSDRKFVWADAKIEGDTVVVGSEKVQAPVAVRYGWADNPVCNLYNKEGLPASPFRTDDWPGLTAGRK
jgi:sialate O-acetylesterase